MFVKYRDGFGVDGGNAQVAYWQAVLVNLGANIGADGIDGKYGSDTAAAVVSLVGGEGQSIGWGEAAELNRLTGNEGAQGPVGPQGIQGTVGPDGPRGVQGLRGQDGHEGTDGEDAIVEIIVTGGKVA